MKIMEDPAIHKKTKCRNSKILVLLADIISSMDDSDSDSSDDSDSESVALAMLGGLLSIETPHNRHLEFIAPTYALENFQHYFRVTRNTFEFILGQFEHAHNVPQEGRGGRPRLGPAKHLLISLWYFASQEAIRFIARRFEVSNSSVLIVVRRVTCWLTETLSPIFISWPSGNRAKRVSRGFQERGGFPRTIGAIESTHIIVKTPQENAVEFVNKQGFHSVVVQGVVDHQLLFTDVYSGCPGGFSPAAALKCSPLYIKAVQDPGSLFSDRTTLVGGIAYPSYQWLLTPFKDDGQLSVQQSFFNEVHSASKIVSDIAFKLLKGRFQRLKYTDMSDPAEISKVTHACCVLHNICCLQEEDFLHYLDDEVGDMPVHAINRSSAMDH